MVNLPRSTALGRCSLTALRRASASLCGCRALLTVIVSAVSANCVRAKSASSWSQSNDAKTSLRRTSMEIASFLSCVERSPSSRALANSTQPGRTSPSISSACKLVLWYSVGTSWVPMYNNNLKHGRNVSYGRNADAVFMNPLWLSATPRRDFRAPGHTRGRAS